MATASLTDLATVGLNREPESWPIQNEEEFLALVHTFTSRPARVLVLDTANHRVEFGVGDKESFAHVEDKRLTGLQWAEFPTSAPFLNVRLKLVLAFATSGNKHYKVRPEDAAPLDDVLCCTLDPTARRGA